jgi:hypothetical protein
MHELVLHILWVVMTENTESLLRLVYPTCQNSILKNKAVCQSLPCCQNTIPFLETRLKVHQFSTDSNTGGKICSFAFE